jgi:hypothetical protein
MSENDEKLQKQTFVDAKDYEPKPEPKQQVTNLIKIGDKEVPILKPDIALTLIYGKQNEILAELKMLNATFSKAAMQAKPTEFQSTAPPTTIPSPSIAPSTPQTTAPPVTEQSSRVKEILVALESVKDLLIIDTDNSAMFVIVRPSKFLGSENFSKVASVIRGLGGQYVSAGKNSHFEIPKAPLKK